MINRSNWKNVNAFLQFRQDVFPITDSTVELEEDWLRHVLEWAGERGFQDAPKIRPALPEYLLTARLDGKTKQLSPIYIKKVIRAAYRFFSWLSTHQKGFSMINQSWLDTLKPPKMIEEKEEHEAVTFDEVCAMAEAPVYTIRDRRIRAAAVFWFLSGIRIGAFVSLPLSAVDMDNLTVYQWPKLGVKTKRNKRGTTYLLNIPELLGVVRAWDEEVRHACGNEGMWFAPVSPETGEILSGINHIGNQRHTRARKDLSDWLKKVNLPYHSPHKFRHGNAVYSLKHAKDVPALKAVSQNLMHSNLSTTDGVYGILSENDVKDKIASLGEKFITDNGTNRETIISMLENLLEIAKSMQS